LISCKLASRKRRFRLCGKSLLIGGGDPFWFEANLTSLPTASVNNRVRLLYRLL
jgi:hypothetical protein